MILQKLQIGKRWITHWCRWVLDLMFLFSWTWISEKNKRNKSISKPTSHFQPHNNVHQKTAYQLTSHIRTAMWTFNFLSILYAHLCIIASSKNFMGPTNPGLGTRCPLQCKTSPLMPLNPDFSLFSLFHHNKTVIQASTGSKAEPLLLTFFKKCSKMPFTRL